MSIYDKSSLVLIPSGTKTGKVFSQKPVSGDGDFTFTRASAATRVNADGNIEKETQNLLLQSNSFLTSWVRTGYTLTSGQSGYDGTNNAWLAECTSAGQALYQTSNASGVSTLSFHLKQGTANFLRLRADQSADAIAVFDLSDGSVHSFNGNVIDTNVVDLGGGWYRCSMTWNIDTLSNVQLRAEDGNGSPILGTFYIQDAQLEQGLVARDVITTTTAAVYGGITDNTPRLDYTDSSCPALLLEPQRTNELSHSEYINAAGGYAITGASVTYNSSTSPDGYTNATLFDIPYDNAGFYNFDTGGSKSVGDKLTISLFAKLKSGSVTNVLKLGYGGAAVGGDRLSEFNLSTGTISYSHPSADSVSIKDYGNGWYRLIQTQTCSADGFAGAVMYGKGEMDVYIWGVQSEDAAYATSYIPTYGSSVSRVVDNGYKDGLSVFGTNKGSFFVDAEGPNYNGIAASYLFDLSDNSSDIVNRFAVYAINQNTFNIFTNGGNSFTLDASIRKKILVIWNGTNTKVYANGVKVLDFTYANANPTSINLNSRFNDVEYGKSEFKQVLTFPTALTDQEAIDLTTI
jgi:hypothetical protein